jgi:probable phosphoglycerate mutase
MLPRRLRGHASRNRHVHRALGGPALTRVLLIRHGNTDAVGDHLSGHAPHVHLNDSGRAQVAALVERLRPTKIEAVFSSPLERTKETADAIARNRNLDVVIDRRLIEYDVGAWTGRTFKSMDPLPEWQRFNVLRSVSRPPAGELMLGVQERAVEALLDVHRTHPDATVAVVSHGDVIRAALLFALGMPLDFYYRLEVRPASVSIIELGEEAPRVLLVNGDSACGVL